MKKLILLVALCLIPVVAQAGFKTIAFKKYSTGGAAVVTECHVQGGYNLGNTNIFTPEPSTRRIYSNLSTSHRTSNVTRGFKNYSVTTPIIQIYCYKTDAAGGQNTAVTVKTFLNLNYDPNSYFPFSNGLWGTQ